MDPVQPLHLAAARAGHVPESPARDDSTDDQRIPLDSAPAAVSRPSGSVKQRRAKRPTSPTAPVSSANRPRRTLGKKPWKLADAESSRVAAPDAPAADAAPVPAPPPARAAAKSPARGRLAAGAVRRSSPPVAAAAVRSAKNRSAVVASRRTTRVKAAPAAAAADAAGAPVSPPAPAPPASAALVVAGVPPLTPLDLQSMTVGERALVTAVMDQSAALRESVAHQNQLVGQLVAQQAAYLSFINSRVAGSAHATEQDYGGLVELTARTVMHGWASALHKVVKKNRQGTRRLEAEVPRPVAVHMVTGRVTAKQLTNCEVVAKLSDAQLADLFGLGGARRACHIWRRASAEEPDRFVKIVTHVMGLFGATLSFRQRSADSLETEQIVIIRLSFRYVPWRPDYDAVTFPTDGHFWTLPSEEELAGCVPMPLADIKTVGPPDITAQLAAIKAQLAAKAAAQKK